MTRAQFLAQQREAEKTLAALAKIIPGAFDKQGQPLVAVARFPTRKDFK